MPKIVDHERRRAEISEAAAELIGREGFDRFTMRELAAELGYAHGALVRYFPNKQALLTASFLHLFAGADARIARTVDGHRGLDALERMSREILPFGAAGARAARVVMAFWNLATQDTAIWEIHNEHNSRWRGLMRTFLQQARDDEELAGHVDIDTAVTEIAARNAGWQMLSCLMGAHSNDETIETGLVTFIAGLRAEDAQSGTGADDGERNGDERTDDE